MTWNEGSVPSSWNYLGDKSLRFLYKRNTGIGIRPETACRSSILLRPNILVPFLT